MTDNLNQHAMSSDSLNELFAALIKVQSALETASKSSQAHKYKYADLAECWSVAKEPLSANGFCVIQVVEPTANGAVLVSILGHKSGQWIKSRVPLMNKSGDMQGLGSSITYARRYSLCALIGISQEDDDGQEACKAPAKAKQSAIEPVKETSMEDLVKEVLDLIKRDEKPQEIKDNILKAFAIKDVSEIPADKIGGTIKGLKTRLEKQQEERMKKEGVPF